MLTSDEKLIVWGHRGSLALVDAARSTKSYRELSRRELRAPSDVWPHVVLSGGRLYCKAREGKLTCFAVLREK